MTHPDPPSDRAAIESAGRWCAGMAAALAAASARAATLAVRIAHDWPDDLGREQAERAAALHRELERDADAAEQLGRTLARHATEATGLPSSSLLPGWTPGGARDRGARLGGTEAERVAEGRGMRIAQLPDPGPTG